MLLILTLFLFFFFSPLTAWAYFDPGFGGYLVNSIITLIVTGFAFVSAAVIYFFRTIIGQKLFSLWQKHEKLCLIVLLSVLGIGNFFLGTSLHSTLFKPSGDHSPLSGARIIDSQRMFKGYNLYDGYLIDEYGRIIKQWTFDNLEGIDKNGNYYATRYQGGGDHKKPSWVWDDLGFIDKNGDYYATRYQDEQNRKEPSWGRYTWDYKVIWEKHFLIHHELYLSPKGTIFTFTKEGHNYNNYKVDFDIILEFDKNGKELQRFSFWDHLKEFQPYHAKFVIDVIPPTILLPLRGLWQKFFKPPGGSYEYFHLNSFFMIPPNALESKNPAFRPGNWLISMFHGSMVFILDQDTKKILWHAVANEIKGSLEGQHSASMLPDGNILLFDNGVDRGASRILIIDPLTLKIKWQYSNINFFTRSGGFVQALPNGNFLVTESKKNHFFELTPDKKIVWEYYDPLLSHSTYRMTRYPKEMIDRLLKKGGPS